MAKINKKDLVICAKIEYLCKLASCIASDNVPKIDILLKNLKNESVENVKIYETILHSYLFCGFPAVIESLRIFKKYFPEFKPKIYNYDVKKFKTEGITNCNLIYKDNYKKLIKNMNYYSHDMKEWMLIEGYGKVMGRSGLNLKERELVTVSILSTKYYESQLHSHIKGCLNLNISENNIKAILKFIKPITGIKNYYKSSNLLKVILLK